MLQCFVSTPAQAFFLALAVGKRPRADAISATMDKVAWAEFCSAIACSLRAKRADRKRDANMTFTPEAQKTRRKKSGGDQRLGAFGKGP